MSASKQIPVEFQKIFPAEYTVEFYLFMYYDPMK